jgi:hypothetical protein
MQKHERETLAAAREEAARYDMTVELENSNGPKKRLRLHAPDRDHVKPLSSSPRDGVQDVDHARQWVRRIGKGLSYGAGKPR